MSFAAAPPLLPPSACGGDPPDPSPRCSVAGMRADVVGTVAKMAASLKEGRPQAGARDMHNVEMLEGRRLMSTAPFGVTPEGTLLVQGTDGDDAIVVTSSGSTFTVGINVLQGFVFTGVTRVQLEGSAGNDQIVYRGDADVPVELLGGGGRDTLHGDGPHVTLSGGDANDDLFAEGSAGMFLVGGRGGDRMFGSVGNDTFFGCAGDDYAQVVTPRDVRFDDIERAFAVAD